MPDIMIVLACLSRWCLDATTQRQLSRITEAMLSMTERVTMRGMARWTDKGGSYRTVQRFFTTRINWIADLLNIVIIVKTNLKTQAIAHVVLFSSDLELAYDELIDSYRLRFQLDFNVRDAKQFYRRNLTIASGDARSDFY